MGNTQEEISRKRLDRWPMRRGISFHAYTHADTCGECVNRNKRNACVCVYDNKEARLFGETPFGTVLWVLFPLDLRTSESSLTDTLTEGKFIFILLYAKIYDAGTLPIVCCIQFYCCGCVGWFVCSCSCSII